MAHSELVNRLDAALRQLSGGLGTATAAFQAVESVAAAHDASDGWEAAAHSREEELALRG